MRKTKILPTGFIPHDFEYKPGQKDAILKIIKKKSLDKSSAGIHRFFSRSEEVSRIFKSLSAEAKERRGTTLACVLKKHRAYAESLLALDSFFKRSARSKLQETFPNHDLKVALAGLNFVENIEMTGAIDDLIQHVLDANNLLLQIAKE